MRPISQLLIALRFFALGSMEITIADFAGVSITSVCRILKRVSYAIAYLRSRFVKMPCTEAELLECSKAFYAIARFKGWFSINVQTICAANLKIQNIVARWPGASHDQTIFNNSKIKMELERGDFHNCIIVGDSGYRNTSCLATPLLNCTTDIETLYNESQIRTRNAFIRCVEKEISCTFYGNACEIKDC